jgi:leucyl-tRNA synthetase
MKKYNPLEIEKKWQERWENQSTYKASDNDRTRQKYYALIEFPYPSGEGLHVGHPRPYTAMDILARKRRLQGYNVLFAMGWDAFGLPTENYAIKNKIHPREVTNRNVERFKAQLKLIGLSFDWSREINTTDPQYYKWTQWIFLKLFEKGLAYKKEMPINWCTSCKVGLANEEVVNGACERCGGEVVRRVKNQWILKITDYADRLLKDLDLVDYMEKIKIQQKNWIGLSQGMEILFNTTVSKPLTVYTTRPDTLFGVTYMVIAPEHPIINEFKDKIDNYSELEEYRIAAGKKSDFERAELFKEKTGVKIQGIKAINPATDEEIPIWVSDYVLMSYGTGGVMAVPAHDIRDYEFAKKYNIPIVEVVEGGNIEIEAYTDIERGTLINSGFLNGLNVSEAQEKVSQWLVEESIGTRKVNYKLRDWVFSRQRYWGEPIPLIYCDKCGWVPLKEKDLPLLLPDIEDYKPTDNGESPLANIKGWVETSCPNCGANGRRETDTMPQWAGSSWYYLRYTDPQNEKSFASMDNMNYWLPVDWYNGGMEHTTLHLLYSRFWHKFLYDCGLVPTPEPYLKRTSHGMILAENNEKMSKSRGNVINPDDIIKEYGADAFRVYEMFIGDFEKSVPWSTNGLKGCRRFLEKVWGLREILTDGEYYSPGLENLIHKTIKKVSEDLECLKFNTALASMMTLVNRIYDHGKITKAEYKTLLIILNPIAPHITEELWSIMEFSGEINSSNWPAWDEAKVIDNRVEIAVQVNGKLKGTIFMDSLETKGIIKNKLIQDERFSQLFRDGILIKEVYVPGKVYNIVVKK